MNKKLQAGQALGRSDIPITALIVRILIGGLVSAVVLTVSGLLLASGQARPLSALDIIIKVVSGIMYVGVMSPLARRVAHGRFLAIFTPLYVTGVLTDLIEAYFYTTVLTPFRLAAALIVEALPIIIITSTIVWLVPASAAAYSEPRIATVLRERPLLSWLWRIVGAGAPYALIYLGFGALVTPIEHAYYYDPAFVASLHTQVPPTEVTIILEVVRGILFVIAQLPVIAVMRKSRWVTGLYIALMGAALEGWIPLLGLTSYPVMLRVGNTIELTGDAAGRALLMALLVMLPGNGVNKVSSEQRTTDTAQDC